MIEIGIAGAGMTAFGKFPDRSVTDLAAEAVDAALADSGVDPVEVGMVLFGNAGAPLLTGQAMIQGELALANGPLAGTALVNVENACASGSSAFQLAVAAVRSGQVEAALAVGVEKMVHPDKLQPFRVLGTALDVTDASLGDADRRSSVFMTLYAGEARAYLSASGAPRETLAVAAANAHRYGSLNPKAQYRNAYTPAEIAGARMIDDPLTLLMCSPIGDGAAAVVVTRAERAPVRVRGVAMRSGRPREGGALVTRTADAAYEAAGIRPGDVDVVELHDAASSAQLPILEELGLADRHAAWKRVLDGDTGPGGSLPVNPSGGLVARGHPVGATGVAQLVELVDQLRGRAGERQVRDPRIGLAQTAGGAVTVEDYTPAVCTVSVLERT